MIGRRINLYCNGDITKIENYEQAINDESQTWDCHHRLESHFSDGTARPKGAFLSIEELKALDMYFNRPPEELIFLKTKDHISLHSSNFVASEETKAKLSALNKGENNGFYGKSHSEETKKQISEKKMGNKCATGKHNISKESFEKMSKTHKGQIPWNKGKHMSEEARKKIAESVKGKHWKLVNGKRVWY